MTQQSSSIVIDRPVQEVFEYMDDIPSALVDVHRVLKPGGRISITDSVSAKQLSQSIVNDPKLWAA